MYCHQELLPKMLKKKQPSRELIKILWTKCTLFHGCFSKVAVLQQRCSLKKSRNSQESTCGKISLFKRLLQAFTFQVFPGKFCYIFKTFFTEHILTTTTGFWRTTPLFQFSAEQEKFIHYMSLFSLHVIFITHFKSQKIIAIQMKIKAKLSKLHAKFIERYF